MKLINNYVLVNSDCDIGLIAASKEIPTNEDVLFLCHTSKVFKEDIPDKVKSKQFRICLSKCSPLVFYSLNVDLVYRNESGDIFSITASVDDAVNYNEKGLIYIFVKVGDEVKLFRIEDVRAKFYNLVEVSESENVYATIKNMCEPLIGSDNGCNFFGCIHNTIAGE
jgi:hypothetical protein